MTNLSGAQTLESMSQATGYNTWTVKKFKSYLGGDILEIGCGIGNFTKTLLDYGRVWAIDINGEYIKQTSSHVKDRANVGIGDIEKGTPLFGNRKFDSIVCLNVLEHIKDDRAALENMFKLLKKGGTLILLVPAFGFLYGEIDKSIGHYRRYEKKQLKNLIENIGFKIIKSKIINFLGAIGWMFSSKIMGEKEVESQKIRIFNYLAPLVLPIEDVIEPPIGTSILIIAKK